MREIITTKDAPGPTRMYSQGVKGGNFVFTSGQVGFIPGTTKLVDQTIEGQGHQTLNNIKAIFAAAGATLDDVVKVLVFLKDIKDFGKFNDIYCEFFPSNPPARSCVEAKMASEDILVEIEAIAYVKE